MDPADLGDRNNWLGGHYQLVLDLGPRDDTRLRAAMEALWSMPELEGPWLPATNAALPARAELPLARLDPKLWGRATIADGRACVCASHAIRFDDGTDWLDLSLPLGALGRTDSRVGGYPVGAIEDSRDWRGPLDGWLLGIATRLFEQVPFRGGLLGMEGNENPAHTVEQVPASRCLGYLVRVDDGLEYFPATY